MFFFNRKKDIHQLSDEELIALYKKRGEEECMGELYNRHYDKLYVVARNMLNDREAAKDIVMTVFEKVLNNVEDTDVQSFSNWVFIITKNECNQYLRRDSTSVRKITEWGDIQRNDGNFVENDALDHLLREEQDAHTQNRVESAIEQLKEEQRTCILLYYFQEKSYKQIAASTGFTDKEVKSYLQNGKKNLAKLLTPNR